MKYGIDVCSYQGRIDWKRVKKAGCGFAVLKCIRKDLNPDTAFARNVAGCTEQKIPVDVYTYVYEGDGKGARKRAEAAVKACQAQGLKGCTIWWDTEDKSIRKTGAKNRERLTESVLAARKVIQAAGYGFGVYCDKDFYTACLNAGDIGGKWWIASYGPNRVTAFGTAPDRRKPVIAGTLWGWQYCSRGRVPGIGGSVDLDVVYGAVSGQETQQQDGNPYPVPTAIVTSTAQAAAKGVIRWVPQGPQVEWVQWELQRLGYDLGKAGVDGICGSKTVAAIEAFQRCAGLTVDGLCGPRTVAALQAAKGQPKAPDKTAEPVNYRSRVAAEAEKIYPLCIGKRHGGSLSKRVTSLDTLKKYDALSCNRMVSIVLQEAGCLPKGCLIEHTAKRSGKRKITDAVRGTNKLRHCKVYWVNKHYKDLPEKWKKAGVVYIQDSNACISAGGGKIWSCNKSKGKWYKVKGDYLRSGGYPFTSKILCVIVPEGA